MEKGLPFFGIVKRDLIRKDKRVSIVRIYELVADTKMASSFCVSIFISFMVLMLVNETKGHESVGLTFELPNKEKICFYEEFKLIKSYVFTYQV